MIFDQYARKVAKAFSAPPKRTILSLDFETYSECDLPKTGASVYSRHPTTEVLMLAYATSRSEIKQWVPSHGEEMPDDLWSALNDPSVTLSAWNAPFEMAIFKNTLNIDLPIWRWMDVMAQAYSLALPGKLETCGKVVGLPQDKQKSARGKLLIRKFCKPRKPTKNLPHTRSTRETDPQDWAEFLEYNRQDVEAERSIYRKIKAFPMPDHEWDLWHLDQKINEAGIPINMAAMEQACRLTTATVEKGLAEMAELTGLANPNSGAQLLPWLRDHGYWFEDLKKGHVARAADWFLGAFEDGTADIIGYDPVIMRVLELRLQVSKASVKKYPALLRATDHDSLLRGCHQFAGAARTWRWSGRRFQPQNLSKPAKYLEDRVPECVHDIEHLTIDEMWKKYNADDEPRKNTMEVLVAGVRPMVQSPPGHMLVDADLSAIENVVLGWLARDQKILRVFREGLDPYIDFAQDMFKMSYDDIEAEVKAGNKSKRTTAKPGVLGCGYMLGAGAAKENSSTGEIEATGLLGYAWGMGVDLTPQMAKLSVDTFRAKFARVVAFWAEIDEACRTAIRTKKPVLCGYLVVDIKGPFMRISLPSGRHLHYWKPQIRSTKMPWKDRDGKAVFKPSITYEQMENGQWRRVSTHPGKLTENVTQAVARDILANGLTLADQRGIDLRMHVHDQAVGVAPDYAADMHLKTLIECLTTLPWWADKKLPLKAAGFVSPIFLKD